jgi:hypothetical protein
MDAKDADAFEFAWDKIHEAFFAATNKVLAFKAWSKDGWLVTMGGDMESAPWIGMARSFIKRMDPDNRPTVDEFLAKVCRVCRVCRRHALEYVTSILRILYNLKGIQGSTKGNSTTCRRRSVATVPRIPRSDDTRRCSDFQ